MGSGDWNILVMCYFSDSLQEILTETAFNQSVDPLFRCSVWCFR